MPASVGSLAIDVSTNTASLEAGLNRASDLLSKFANQGISKFRDLTIIAAEADKAIRNIAAATGIPAFVGLIQSAIGAQAELSRLSEKTGFTVESLSALKTASSIVGANFDSVTTGLSKLDKAMFQAATEGGQTAAAFKGLGVEIKTASGNLREPNDVLLDLAKRFAEMEEGATKSALAQKLFGRAGQELIPVLNEIGDAAQYVGKVTKEQAAIAEDLEKNWHRLEASGKGIWNTIAGAITPALDALARAFLQVINQGGGLREWIQKLAAEGSLQAWAQKAGFIVAEFADAVVDVINVVSRIPATLSNAGTYFKGFSEVVAGGWLILTGQIQRGSDLAATGLEEMRAGFSGVGKAISDFAVSTKFKDAFTGAVVSMSQFTAVTREGKSAVADFAVAVKERFTNLAPAVDAYIKSLANLQKAQADAIGARQLAAIKTAQDGIKQQYERGIIDFQQYWDAKTALQRTALQVQEKQLQDDVDIAARAVKDLQTQLDALDPTKFKSPAEYFKAWYEAAAKVNDAQAKLETEQGKLNVAIERGTEIGKDYVEALIAASNGLLLSNKALDDEIEKRTRQNQEIGLTASQIAALNVARVTELRNNALLTGAAPEVLAFYDGQIERLGRLQQTIASGENLQRINDAWRSVFTSLADRGASFITDFVQHGSSAFKNLWNDFKTWALEALAKIAAQQIVIQIAGALGIGGIAANAFAGSSPLATLLGLNNAGGLLFNGAPTGGLGGGIFPESGGGGALSGLNNLPTLLGLPSFTNAVTNLSTILPTFSTALENGSGIFSAATQAFAGTAASFATVAIPVIGVALAAASAFGLFDKKPSPTRGQFQITPTSTTTGFEDNRFTTSSFGNLGFADAATQYFSGEAAQAFNQIVANALDAFQSRYTKEQSDRLASILQTTTFPQSTGGTQSTEDFIKQYGGEILRQVVEAAFGVLDPALGSVVTSFQGTADELSKFGNTLLSIHDATASFGADFQANVVAALSDATQATADKVLAFVSVISQFGDALTGLGPKLESLDPTSITAFVDALGGAQKFAATFQYLGANFTTSAARIANAAALLNTDFADLGLAVPKTHEQFLALLNSFDLTTDSGREMYASVAALAPLFVQVAGTADQAAQALQKQIDSAQEFFDQNFFSGAEQAAQRIDAAWEQVHQAWTDMGSQLQALGVDHIPTTNAGFRALIEQVKAVNGADSELYRTLIQLAPAIFGLNQDLGDLADTADTAAGSITALGGAIIVSVGSLTQQGGGIASAFLQSISGLVSAIEDTSTQYAVKIQLISAEIDRLNASNLDSLVLAGALAPLNDALNQAAADLAQFTVLSAQYGDGIAKQLVALQDWYDEQNKILTGGQSSADITQQLDSLQAQLANAVQYGYDEATVNFIQGQINSLQGTAELLGALDTVFQSKWNAIVSGSSAAAQSLDDFIKSIQQLADATQGNAGQQAGIELALSSAKITQLQQQYATLDPTSVLARSIAAQIARLQTYNAGLATQIAHYTIYTAQYNAAIANQLVELENWYAQQQEALAGNNDALAILGDIFQDKWNAIIDGISDGVDQLSRLKVDIAEYLKKLVISDISPLTPRQKLDTARQSLEAEIALAQGGDLKALGDVTQYLDAFLALDRDFNKSNDQFAADFALYTGQLANIAGVQPSGQPLDSSAAIVAVLPTSGTLASSDDMKAVRDLLQRLITDLADANTADSIAEREVFVEAAAEITAAINGTLELK